MTSRDAEVKKAQEKMFGADPRIDPRTRSRTVPMEVICPGLPRTGTSSVKKALEILGVEPVAHMSTAVRRQRDLSMWADAAEAKFTPEKTDLKPFGLTEWDNLLGDYRATTDTPGCFFAVELMAAYPDAKVVLVERDVEKWYKSFSSTVMTVQFPTLTTRIVLSALAHKYGGLMKAYTRLTRAIWRVNSKEELEMLARQRFHEHYAEVRAAAKPGQLLEYKLGDGWEPLCKFLGKPIPDEPFPHVNDTAMFHEIGRSAMRSGLKEMFKSITMWGLTLAAVGTVAVNYGVKEWVLTQIKLLQ